MRGRFISIEGGKAVGKSTQIRLLADWVRREGREITLTREPGGTDSAEAIRKLLLEGGADRWNARSEALLFAAARADHVARLIRPAVEAGEKLGFLPGDLNEKVDPYLAPIWEALNDILGAEDVQRRRDKGEIEAAPIAFMRGRTLSHAFVIVDEAQNTSRLQMKMVLTRLGEGARMVVTGDPSQIDLLNPRDSGLAHALRILDGVQGVGILKFEASDVVRHAMVERIVRAYDADAARGRPAPDLEDPA